VDEGFTGFVDGHERGSDRSGYHKESVGGNEEDAHEETVPDDGQQ
jgi:hypothetical protein